MKIFLTTCIVAMISAGIYGTIDLANDIHQGTLIQYEKDDGPEKENGIIVERNLVHAVRNLQTKKIENNANPAPEDLEIRAEYFSRGEPLIFEDAFEDSALIVADTSSVVEIDSNVKDSVKAEIAGDKKLDLKLYSRSRPRSFPKEVTLALKDSMK